MRRGIKDPKCEGPDGRVPTQQIRKGEGSDAEPRE